MTKAATTIGRTLLGSMPNVNVVFVEPSFPQPNAILSVGLRRLAQQSSGSVSPTPMRWTNNSKAGCRTITMCHRSSMSES